MSSHNHHVVVIGGGITGLSAAFYLARKHPTVQITLVEKSTRFGGWVRSERVEVCDSHGNRARVLLEAGPRTIRPNAKSILELVRAYLHYRFLFLYSSGFAIEMIGTSFGLAFRGHLYAPRFACCSE